MADYRIAVLDVGKTNKKLFVYDSEFVCLNPGEGGIVFDEVERDGLVCDDMESIRGWMIEGLRRAAKTYPGIRVISISTHGATIALLGRERDRVFAGDGGLVFPVVSYMQQMTEGEDEAFYGEMGLAPDEMQRRTGTSRMGWLLNHGKQAWFLKKRFPERFAAVTNILMFPQYLSYLLTGKKAIEPSYIGCHGLLMDVSGEKYSVVAERLGIAGKLPGLPFAESWRALGMLVPDIARETGLAGDTIVTVGAHDSNAALVPYFASGLTDFVMQDSGTWVVTMSPAREATFAPGEVGKEVFFNWSVYGTPVKTTIFRGGAEFEFYRTKVLRQWAHPEELDEAVLGEIVAKREAFSLPTLERGSGLFPESVARLVGVEAIFRDAATAWCVVDLGLAVQGYHAIRMAAGEAPETIFIEGNMGRSNPVYRAVISGLFPRARALYGTGGGAALGAAILGAAAVEGKRPEDFGERRRLELEEAPKSGIDAGALSAYADEFIARVRSGTDAASIRIS